jgi:hypothetical protein
LKLGQWLSITGKNEGWEFIRLQLRVLNWKKN